MKFTQKRLIYDNRARIVGKDNKQRAQSKVALHSAKQSRQAFDLETVECIKGAWIIQAHSDLAGDWDKVQGKGDLLAQI